MKTYKMPSTSPIGRIYRMYDRQKVLSKTRKHPPPSYTFRELFTWVTSQSKWYTLFLNWIASEYNRSLTPTIDREDSNKSYSFDNIRLVTLKKNKANFHKEEKERTYIRGRAVTQYSLSGHKLLTFANSRVAQTLTGICHSSIVQCCDNTSLTAGGFQWAYTDLNIQKMPETKVGGKNASKAVIQLNLDGNILKEYTSTAKAGKCTKTCISSISKVCKGERKTAGGFKWRYKDDL